MTSQNFEKYKEQTSQFKEKIGNATLKKLVY